MVADKSEVIESLKQKFGDSPPDLAMILGSGLGDFAKNLENAKSLPYSDLKGFPRTTVPGHEGIIHVGKIGKRRVLTFQGRFHYFEGHPLSVVTLPVRMAGKWGIPALVVTNAAGTTRTDWKPGSLALISDHINGMGENPLRGPNLDSLGPRFFDLANAYDPAFRMQFKKIARKSKIRIHEGVYIALSGPSYETPAEIKMFRRWGADLVGMSTVPEVIVARHQGMRVLGISCITNWAAGVKGKNAPRITHEEVMEITQRVRNDFARFLKQWIEEYE